MAKLGKDDFIDDEAVDYLSPTGDVKAGRFYFLPKLHKKGCPGRHVTFLVAPSLLKGYRNLLTRILNRWSLVLNPM